MNKALVLMRESKRQSVVDSGSSAGSARSGTRDPNSFSLDATSGLTPLDRHFDRMTKHGPPHLIFTGPNVGAILSSPQVFGRLSKAVGASATQRPSEKLLELIRSGKLLEVGFAVPRPLNSVQTSDEAHAIGSMLFTESGPILQHGKTTPPPVPSSQAFCMALFSTILSALADRTDSMWEWVALAKTALQLEAESGWARANAYVEQVLQERIPQRQGLTEPSDTCLRTIRNPAVTFAIPGGGSASGGPHSSDRSAGQQQRRDRDGTCHIWNHQGTCSRETNCQLRHACSYWPPLLHRAARAARRCHSAPPARTRAAGLPA